MTSSLLRRSSIGFGSSSPFVRNHRRHKNNPSRLQSNLCLIRLRLQPRAGLLLTSSPVCLLTCTPSVSPCVGWMGLVPKRGVSDHQKFTSRLLQTCLPCSTSTSTATGVWIPTSWLSGPIRARLAFPPRWDISFFLCPHFPLTVRSKPIGLLR